ncbi:MAG TPA: lasso peptide biosynthesis B2 protein [Syntrophomonadaceae bacterium]|nr:lasso peptide biosynthesis B2 protein [Syntrophomonadaceae bacterium]
MKSLSGFLMLSSFERIRLIRLLAYIIRAEAVLSFLPYSVTRKLVFISKTPRRGCPSEPLDILYCHLRLLVKITRNTPWSITCLRQAVALRDALAADGVESQIKIGLLQHQEAFEAHAWLECCGLEILKNGEYSELSAIKGGCGENVR